MVPFLQTSSLGEAGVSDLDVTAGVWLLFEVNWSELQYRRQPVQRCGAVFKETGHVF